MKYRLHNDIPALVIHIKMVQEMKLWIGYHPILFFS